MVAGLSLVAGGGGPARPPGAPERLPLGRRTAVPAGAGERFALPGANGPPTLAELFTAAPRDGGWAGFLLPQLPVTGPWMWVQERMAILESGRVYPPGLPGQALIHVEARDARDALWAMEEGLRCAGLGAVIGEIWGDPAALDFTATRRLAVAAERTGVAAFLIRLGGHANLSGARIRWRVASAPSLVHLFDPRAPGAAAWDAALFRARGRPPGQWVVSHEPGQEAGAEAAFHLVADVRDRPLDTGQRRSA